MKTWHLEILGHQQQRTLQELGPALRPLRAYLVGGTALALHLGHRRSVDMDFFLYGALSEPRTLVRELRAARIPVRVRDISEKAIQGSVRKIKLTIMSYDHLRLRRTVRCSSLNCELAAMDDLAAMKLAAVRLRAARRDYVDVWAMLRSGRSLRQLLKCYQRKFEVEDCRKVVHQLLNFDKLKHSRMPRMLWDVRWPTIQAELTEAVNPFRQTSQELLP
jgi:predicted nucleotidyltransferase component of viral defense system